MLCCCIGRVDVYKERQEWCMETDEALVSVSVFGDALNSCRNLIILNCSKANSSYDSVSPEAKSNTPRSTLIFISVVHRL